MSKTKCLLLALAAAAVITGLMALGFMRPLDRSLQDQLFQHPGAPDTDILILGIDEEALDLLGPYNTWDRTVLASALEALAADPSSLPAVVAVDVLYAGTTNPAADARLVEAAKSLNLVTATMAVYGSSVTWESGRAAAVNASAVVDYEEPFDALKACTTQGHINAMNDLDGILRHALLYVKPGDGRVYSMASQVARLYLEHQGKTLTLPDIPHLYVPFSGRPGDYSDGISVAWLIAGKIPPGYWKDKIVLIGPYAPALQDSYFTSIDKATPMYGVEFQANVIQSLLEGNFKSEVEALPQLIALFLLSAAAGYFFLRSKLLWGGAACLGLVILGAGAPWLLYRLGYVTHVLWLPFSALTLYILAVGEHYLRAARERQALALEKERIGAELALAARIQSSSLPKVFPPFPDRTEFDIYASMTPAREVGGDLYDFFLIDDDHLGMVIGDVTGKGVPASLFMMVAASLIRNAAMSGLSPARSLETVNTQILSRNPEEMFVTVWLGVLEISTGKLTAANAGHEYPALKRPGIPFELYKDRHGFVLGGMEGMRYREYELQLEPGARIFVYTDGLTEATNAAAELFGTDRVVEALQGCDDGSPGDIISSVKQAVDRFVGAAPQFDDLTMLCLQYNGPAQPSESSEPSPAQAEPIA